MMRVKEERKGEPRVEERGSSIIQKTLLLLLLGFFFVAVDPEPCALEIEMSCHHTLSLRLR